MYGVIAATIWYVSSIWCASLVLGFLHDLFLLRYGSWLDYIIDGIYPRKVGWVFPRVWGFPRINSCVFLCLFMLFIFPILDIILNVKEYLITLIYLLL
jgi:hypothetical protein